jgi:hypothetical protein
MIASTAPVPEIEISATEQQYIKPLMIKPPYGRLQFQKIAALARNVTTTISVLMIIRKSFCAQTRLAISNLAMPPTYTLHTRTLVKLCLNLLLPKIDVQVHLVAQMRNALAINATTLVAYQSFRASLLALQLPF